MVLLRACFYGKWLLTTGCSSGGASGPLPHPRPCHRTDHAAATLCVLEVQRHRGVRRQLVGGTSVCGHDLGKRCVWLALWHFCGIMSTARCFPRPTTRPNPACVPCVCACMLCMWGCGEAPVGRYPAVRAGCVLCARRDKSTVAVLPIAHTLASGRTPMGYGVVAGLPFNTTLFLVTKRVTAYVPPPPAPHPACT